MKQSKRLIFGVGINDANYVVQPKNRLKGAYCIFYRTWVTMLSRCYSKGCKKRQPTYKKCSVIKEWHSFMNFKAWMETQDWNGKQLDKDIILPNNKIYSPDFCAFVTREVNSLLTDRAALRGLFPCGVIKRQERFVASCSVNGRKKHLGVFNTPEEASRAYLEFKSNHVRKIAHHQSDIRVKDGLMRHADIILSKITT